MTISFDIPQPFDDALRAEWRGSDLNEAAKEAFIIESYRRGKISLGYLAQLVGLQTSIQAQRWLAQRGIPLNYDHNALDADRETLTHILDGDDS